MNINIKDKPYLTTKEAMEILGCSRQYISKLRNTEKISTYRRGNEYLVSSEELNDFLLKKTTIVKIRSMNIVKTRSMKKSE
jgi:excisionase family DNA binding protein